MARQNGILQLSGDLGDAATREDALAQEAQARRIIDNRRAITENQLAVGNIVGRGIAAGGQTYKDYAAGKIGTDEGQVSALHDFGQRFSGRDPFKAASNTPNGQPVQPTVGITQDNAPVASAFVRALHGWSQDPSGDTEMN